MTTANILLICGLVILIPCVGFIVYFVSKQIVNDYKIDNSVNFPDINEIEYREPEPFEDPKAVPTIGSFYIKKENAEKNPFIYPRYIYRVDSVKRNYYGDTWIKVSSKCYDMNSFSTDIYPTEYIPLDKFLEENQRIYKSKIDNIDSYKAKMKHESRKNALTFKFKKD